MKKKISIFLALLMMFSIFSITTKANAKTEENLDYISILEGLGADFSQLRTMSRNYKSVSDDVLDIPNDVKGDVINFNNTSYAVVENDSIKYIDKLVEMSDDRTERFKSAKKINFLSQENVIEYVKEKLIKDNNYVLTNKYDFDNTTVVYNFNYKENGVTDTFNYANIVVDKESNELLLFHRSGENNKINLYDNFIGNERASQKAQDVLHTMKLDKKLKFEGIKTVKTNDILSSYTKIKNDSEEIRVAYVFKNSSVEIYIDAITGDCVGGDIFKALGGVIGAPELDYTQSSINAAVSGMKKLGYSPVMSRNTQNFKSEVYNILKSGTRGFYACSHGNEDVISSRKNVDNQNRIFHRNSVPYGTYKFIYLDACNTAVNSDWANAFGIYDGTSSNKAFLGWYDSVGQKLSYDFSINLWKKLNRSISVRTAALRAADQVDGYCKIRFGGDRNYNGFN